MQRLTPELYCLSLARRGTPAWISDRVPAGADMRRWMLDRLCDLAPERLVLHTCERFEVYVAAEGFRVRECLRRMAAWLDLEPEVLAPYVAVRWADEVAGHLFRVTAGLESRLVGEPQIRLQVRQAFLEARAAGAVGPLLDALLRAALHTGRVVRRKTLLGQGTSVVTLAVERLRAELGTLRGRLIVVAGTGGLAADVVAALSASWVRTAVSSRRIERAQALAFRFQADVTSPVDLGRCLTRADALVACTHGRVPIDSSAIAGRPFSIIDLGMPPNIDPTLAALPAVRLTRLEDLTGPDGGAEVARAARLVSEERLRFRRWWIARQARRLEIARLAAADLVTASS
jgi:glutamyl-tRNA reductase